MRQVVCHRGEQPSGQDASSLLLGRPCSRLCRRCCLRARWLRPPLLLLVLPQRPLLDVQLLRLLCQVIDVHARCACCACCSNGRGIHLHRLCLPLCLCPSVCLCCLLPPALALPRPSLAPAPGLCLPPILCRLRLLLLLPRLLLLLLRLLLRLARRHALPVVHALHALPLLWRLKVVLNGQAVQQGLEAFLDAPLDAIVGHRGEPAAGVGAVLQAAGEVCVCV